MKGNVINLNTLHLNSVRLNGIGKVQSVSLKGGSTEDPVFPPVEPPVEPEPTPTYTLSASVTNGMVSATRNGSAVNLPFTANEGDVIVVEVTPNDGYAFEGWADGNTDNPRTITMNADVALSAQCVEVVQPPVGKYIQFEDAEVERVLMSKGVSSDGVGITMEDAAAVTSIGDIFVGNTAITSFDEFQYFTGIEVVGSFGWGSAHGFSGCTSLRSIVLPKSAKSLCNGCFKDTRSLTSLKGTENVTTLGHSSYGNDTFMNSAVTDVDFSNLQEIIGNDAFLGSGIKVVNFPKLKKLGMGAFKNSKVERVISLGEVTSLDGTSDYMRGMFYGCTFLESVALPKTLHTIGALCFRNCSALKDCNIPESVTTIGAEAFYGASLDGMDIVLKNVQNLQASTFKQSKTRSIIMPNVITTAGTIDFAAGNFYQCTSLEYTLFGKTLSSIGGGEFNNSSKMGAFVCLANVPPKMAAKCFDNTLIASGSGYIYVPNASLEAYKTATNWNAYADKIKGINDLATDNPTLYAEIEEYL